MKIVVQRSLESSVSIDNEIISTITKGMVLLVCLENGDDDKTVLKAAQKLMGLRIFPDDQGRMNKNILDFGAEIMVVSQFTLSWNGRKGNRPSFDNSMAPELAISYLEKLCTLLAQKVKVSKGIFGENMKVTIVNDGPVTFFLEF